MEPTGKTRICAVIGDPIAHSLSPIMHNAAFTSLGLDFIYVAFQVKRNELEKAISGIRSLGIHGLNVTMPHKSAVVEHLDEIDANAKSVGSVNTVLNRNAKFIGFNTDGVGALRSLQENGVRIKGKNVLLLGAGGAARAIAFQIAKEAQKIVILNRTVLKAEKLAEALTEKYRKNNISAGVLSPKTIKENLKYSNVLINATSMGMHPKKQESLVDPQWLKHDLSVLDIVYDPIETQLAKDAKAAGCRVISGIEMLIYQGAASFEIWTDQAAPVQVMKKAILNKLSKVGVKL